MAAISARAAPPAPSRPPSGVTAWLRNSSGCAARVAGPDVWPCRVYASNSHSKNTTVAPQPLDPPDPLRRLPLISKGNPPRWTRGFWGGHGGRLVTGGLVGLGWMGGGPVMVEVEWGAGG